MNLDKQRKMCLSKTRYPDKRAAHTAYNLAMKKRGRHGRAMELRIYPCPNCGGHHLTKQREDEA